MSRWRSCVMLQPSEIPEAVGGSQGGKSPLGAQTHKGVIWEAYVLQGFSLRTHATPCPGRHISQRVDSHVCSDVAASIGNGCDATARDVASEASLRITGFACVCVVDHERDTFSDEAYTRTPGIIASDPHLCPASGVGDGPPRVEPVDAALIESEVTGRSWIVKCRSK